MFAGAMLLGVLAVLGLPDLATNDKQEDEGGDRPAGGDDPAGFEPRDDDGALLEVVESHEFLAGGVPGVSLIEDFRPGEDVLNLRVPGEVEEVVVQDAGDGTPASISYAWADETVEVRFAGLESVPVEDIFILIDGEGEGIPLAGLAPAGRGRFAVTQRPRAPLGTGR